MMNLLKSVTVYDMKLMIEAREGIPVGQQRLIFGGRYLEESRTLEELGISTVSLRCDARSILAAPAYLLMVRTFNGHVW